MNQINVDEKLKVTFTASELHHVINHLLKGSMEFVEFPVSILREGMLRAHNESQQVNSKPVPENNAV